MTTSTLTPTNASAISRLLRKGGLYPQPAESNRHGVYVTGRGIVSIRLWLDLDGQRRRMAESVSTLLTEGGYSFEVNLDDDGVPSGIRVDGRLSDGPLVETVAEIEAEIAADAALTPTAIAEAGVANAKAELSAADEALRAAQRRVLDAQDGVVVAERTLAQARVDESTGALPVGTRVRHYGFTDILGTVVEPERAGLSVLADGSDAAVHGYERREWIPVEPEPEAPAANIVRDVTLTDYNGEDLALTVCSMLVSGFAITINGDRVAYGDRPVSVAGNGSLYFRTPARTTRGTKVVYVKVGDRVVVAYA